MPTNIKLLTDTAADLPDELLARYDIDMVPLTINFGQESYRDRFDLTIPEFYQKLQTSPHFPATTQVNPNQFVDIFQEHLDKGKEILFIGLSLKLSGTVQSAQLAKEMLKTDRIHVFDSYSLSLGEGMCVLKAAELVATGASMTEVIDGITQHRAESFAYILLDSLNHLVRGGRLRKSQAIVGSVLSIKPILTTTELGAVYVGEKVRTQSRALNVVIKRAKERHPDYSQKMVGVAHSNDPELGVSFAKMVEQELKPKGVVLSSVGATIGTHAGPGGVGLFV